MRSDTGFAAIMIVAFAAVGLYLYFYFTRARQLLDNWASENRFQLLRAEFRMFRKGPFFWSGRNQAVYRVEIRDEGGNDRTGWVRCGTWWLGVFANSVEVKWDDH